MFPSGLQFLNEYSEYSRRYLKGPSIPYKIMLYRAFNLYEAPGTVSLRFKVAKMRHQIYINRRHGLVKRVSLHFSPWPDVRISYTCISCLKFQNLKPKIKLTRLQYHLPRRTRVI